MRIAQRIIRPYQQRKYNPEFRVVNEDWDTLIVLDGCREDLFSEVVNISKFDSYETRTSAGSATNEWVRKNFAGQALSDTVYVTGNPVVSRQVQTAFHAFIEVWRDGFDEELGTVPPTKVTEAAIEAHQKYPNKRLIVHYMQPHYPFLNHPDLRYTNFQGTEEMEVSNVKTGASDVWDALGEGLIDYDTVWRAYADNLDMAMKSVEDLLEETEGKTVITSDHGNLVVERVSPLKVRLYRHPPYIHHPDLRKVPWAIIGDKEDEHKSQVGTTVEEQLRTLGYK